MKQATLVEKGSHSKSQGPVLPSLPSGDRSVDPRSIDFLTIKVYRLAEIPKRQATSSAVLPISERSTNCSKR